MNHEEQNSIRSFQFVVGRYFAWLRLCPRSSPCRKQERRERTIDEIKVEAIHRAEVGQYPLIGLDPGDVKEAFETIHTATKTSGRRDSCAWPTATSTKPSRWRRPIRRRPTPTTFAPGGSIRSGAGRFRRLRASSARTRRRSRRFWRTPSFWIRRSKSCTFRSKAKKSSATCGCRKMRRGRCRW